MTISNRTIRQKIARLQAGNQPRVLDLFAGCGGISLGFTAAGYTVAAAVEFDPEAAASHGRNFHGGDPAHSQARDITKTRPEDLVRDLNLGKAIEAFDVLVGGPPCQAFARVGRPKLREVDNHAEAFKHDPRAQLYIDYLRYVEAFAPLAVLVENVPDVLNHGGQNIAEEIAEVLEGKGYVCRYTLLNAAFYGVPQMRERMILIAYRRELADSITFPDPSHFIDLPPGYEGTRSVALKFLDGEIADDAHHYVHAPRPARTLPPAITAEDALGDLPAIDARKLLESGELRRGARRFDVTELLPPSQLVKANGWIEGLTIASIILGVLLGGQLIGPSLSPALLSIDLPLVETGVDTPPEAAISAMVLLYLVAAGFNLRIPRTEAPLQPLSGQPLTLVRDFSDCNARLWRDKLGQISLATTTLFWGVSGNLRYIVLAWAAAALGYGTTQASSLVGVVAIGTAVGAVLASVAMRLDQAPKVIPLGVGMGLLVICMIAIDRLWVAVPFLVLLGGLGGFLVVPMNALLQHRGHNLMGAGRSIAVQNFNEQACILALGALYTGMTRLGLSAFGAIAIFGLLVAGVMALIGRWHRRNTVRHRDEVDRLLALARSDG